MYGSLVLVGNFTNQGNNFSYLFVPTLPYLFSANEDPADMVQNQKASIKEDYELLVEINIQVSCLVESLDMISELTSTCGRYIFILFTVHFTKEEKNLRCSALSACGQWWANLFINLHLKLSKQKYTFLTNQDRLLRY